MRAREERQGRREGSKRTRDGEKQEIRRGRRRRGRGAAAPPLFKKGGHSSPPPPTCEQFILYLY